MKVKFNVDFDYWALPIGFGFERWGYFWVGILCFNLDVSWGQVKVNL